MSSRLTFVETCGYVLLAIAAGLLIFHQAFVEVIVCFGIGITLVLYGSYRRIYSDTTHPVPARLRFLNVSVLVFLLASSQIFPMVYGLVGGLSESRRNIAIVAITCQAVALIINLRNNGSFAYAKGKMHEIPHSESGKVLNKPKSKNKNGFQTTDYEAISITCFVLTIAAWATTLVFSYFLGADILAQMPKMSIGYTATATLIFAVITVLLWRQYAKAQYNSGYESGFQSGQNTYDHHHPWILWEDEDETDEDEPFSEPL